MEERGLGPGSDPGTIRTTVTQRKHQPISNGLFSIGSAKPTRNTTQFGTLDLGRIDPE